MKNEEKIFLSRDAHTTKVLHPHEEALLLLPNNLNLGKSLYDFVSNHHSNITIVIIIIVDMSQKVNILREPV